MQREFSSLEEKVDEIYDYQIDPDKVEKKLTDLEDRSRRNNLWIDGVAEENGEAWDDCKQKVKDKVKVLQNCKKLKGSHRYIN